jgi:hypothetical protein
MAETTKLQYSWVLWYHDPDNKKYDLDSYVRIVEVSTPQQFWTIVDSISKEAWESGMFFFMRMGFKPIWDVPENEAGGAWSKKVDAKDAYAVFVDVMVHCITNELLSSRKETLVGVTISPKGSSSIIKIWNTTTTVASTDFLAKTTQLRVGEDITYTPHKARPR